jgi:hypothetical protein
LTIAKYVFCGILWPESTLRLLRKLQILRRKMVVSYFNGKEVVTMIAQNLFFGQFRFELKVFVQEALEKHFANVEALNKFRSENRERRKKLKKWARSLGLNFKLEVAEAQENVLAEKKKKLATENK